MLSHSGTWALKAPLFSRLQGIWELEGHLATRALKALGYLGTRALGGHLGSPALKALGHLGAWALEALYLVDSMVCAKKTKTFYLFVFKKSLINLRYVTYLKLNIKMEWIFLK